MPSTYSSELFKANNAQRRALFMRMRRVYGRDYLRFSEVLAAHERRVKSKQHKRGKHVRSCKTGSA